jgi:ubiquinone/menaquinone biosynthesis C-methylase UbiE
LRRLLTISLVVLVLQLTSCTDFKRLAYESFGRRDGWQQPERVVETLGIAPGSRVADLGAGGGYFTFRLAEAVGPDGIVYAVDVDEEMISHLAQTARERGAENVQTVLATFTDPELPDGEIDLVVTVNTYHHLDERPAYFRGLRRDLAPGARVAILDFNGPGFLRRHYSEKSDIVREMEQAGYAVIADHDFIERQNFLVFAPR